MRVSPFTAGPSRMTGGGRVAAPVRTVRWLGVPNPIELVKGETYDLSQHVVGGNPPYGDFLIESGSLPAGVKLSSITGMLTALEDVSVQITGDLEIGVSDTAAS